MTMNDPSKNETQDRFEQHLRGFRPVAPPTLQIRVRGAPWGMLAAAAAVLLIIVLPVVRRRYERSDNILVARTTQNTGPSASVAIPITLGILNAAVRTSDRDLNQILDDASPRLLPHEHRGTALFELGKE